MINMTVNARVIFLLPLSWRTPLDKVCNWFAYRSTIGTANKSGEVYSELIICFQSNWKRLLQLVTSVTVRTRTLVSTLFPAKPTETPTNQPSFLPRNCPVSKTRSFHRQGYQNHPMEIMGLNYMTVFTSTPNNEPSVSLGSASLTLGQVLWYRILP